MTEYADLDDKRQIAGDAFDRQLTLSVNVASFSSITMVIRKYWARLDEDPENEGDDVVTVAELGAEITTIDDTTIRIQIDGADLRVEPRTYVYAVKGVTLLGAPVTLVTGKLPLFPRA
jgi:hypothetical protein